MLAFYIDLLLNIIYNFKQGSGVVINNVFFQIDKLNSCYIDVWEDVCNIESPSSDKAAVDRVGEYFIQIAKKHGWDIEVFEQQRFGNVICITMNKNSLYFKQSQKTIVFTVSFF